MKAKVEHTLGAVGFEAAVSFLANLTGPEVPIK